jgi:NAD(P) transhydrogenase subunit beta
MTAARVLLGAHLVLAIGGGDMPVVVSLLNSYSGWAAAAAGFMLENDSAHHHGCARRLERRDPLSIIMCRAMNRSIWNVVFGGFGAAPAAGAPRRGAAALRQVHETNVDQVAELLRRRRAVIVIPGYGMAVAQAQHPVTRADGAAHPSAASRSAMRSIPSPGACRGT